MLPRNIIKHNRLLYPEKKQKKNLISVNRFELLSCNKNENENLYHWKKYKPFNQIHFNVTQRRILEKSSLNSNGSIVKNLHVVNMKKIVTEQNLIELFVLRKTNDLRITSTWNSFFAPKQTYLEALLLSLKLNMFWRNYSN